MRVLGGLVFHSSPEFQDGSRSAKRYQSINTNGVGMESDLKSSLNKIYFMCTDNRVTLDVAQSQIRYLIKETYDRSSLLCCYEGLAHISRKGYIPETKFYFLKILKRLIIRIETKTL